MTILAAEIAKPADEIAMKQIVDSVYWACKDKYHLEIDTVDHIRHFVSDVFPLIKDSILSTFKAREEQPLQTSSGKKLYTNRQAARIEFEKGIVDISNELLRNGVPCARTPFYK